MMNYPQRKSIRMRGYDYSQGGAYFCTVCVHHCHRHKNLFGRVEGTQMCLNRFGRLVERCWLEAPQHRPNLVLDEWMVMPNHFHGLLWLDAPTQTEKMDVAFGPLATQSLSRAIGAFKADVSREIGRMRNEKTVVW